MAATFAAAAAIPIGAAAQSPSAPSTSAWPGWAHTRELGAWLGHNVIAADTELGNGFLKSDVPGSSVALGIRGGANLIGEWFGLEGEFKMTPTSLGSGTTALVMGLRGGALLHIGPFSDSRLRPFLWLGAGSETLQIESEGIEGEKGHVAQDTDFALHVGIGAKYRVLKRWLARVDVRYLNTAARIHGQTTHNFEISLGASLLVGGRKPKPKPKPVSTAADDALLNADSDGDGVADLADKCTEPEDKDGFQDDDGCPDPDNDGAGIADTDDKCPDKAETRNGYKDTDGCPDERAKPLVVVTREEIQIGEKVFFAVGLATIDERSHALLDAVAGVMKAHPQLTRVVVEGHTDATGDVARNKRLSRSRAQAVVQYLVKSGVTAKRLVAKGVGTGEPLCTDTGPDGQRTEACRDKNRRVEFKIVEVDGKPIKAGSKAVIKTKRVIRKQP